MALADLLTTAAGGAGVAGAGGLSYVYGRRVLASVARVLWQHRGELVAEPAEPAAENFPPAAVAAEGAPAEDSQSQLRAMVELAVTEVVAGLRDEIARLRAEVAELRAQQATDMTVITELQRQIQVKDARIALLRQLLATNGIADTATDSDLGGAS